MRVDPESLIQKIKMHEDGFHKISKDEHLQNDDGQSLVIRNPVTQLQQLDLRCRFTTIMTINTL